MQRDSTATTSADEVGLKPEIPNRRGSLSAIMLGALLVLAVGCGGVIEDRNDVFTVGESPTLVVNNENGYIKVNAGDDNTIHVQTTIIRPSRIEYTVTQNGDTVTVDVERESKFALFGAARSPGAEIEVTAPARTRVQLRSSEGRIEVSGIRQSGTLETSDGKVIMRQVKGDFDVRTSDASIDIIQIEGSATLRTSDANVTLSLAKGAFDVKTSDGAILFTGEMTPGGNNRLVTSDANVTVVLQGEPSVRVEASTSDGSVVSKLPVLTTTTGSKERLIGTIGEGEAELFIKTSDGNVTIKAR